MALVTSMYGIAGVLGPTVGGLITDTPRLTWRFCFWYAALNPYLPHWKAHSLRNPALLT